MDVSGIAGNTEEIAVVDQFESRRLDLRPDQRFVRTVRRDLDAVTNALTEGWSNGQTEGQINRLKTLKRAMYGRAGTELLRARMLPLHLPMQHGK